MNIQRNTMQTKARRSLEEEGSSSSQIDDGKSMMPQHHHPPSPSSMPSKLEQLRTKKRNMEAFVKSRADNFNLDLPETQSQADPPESEHPPPTLEQCVHVQVDRQRQSYDEVRLEERNLDKLEEADAAAALRQELHETKAQSKAMELQYEESQWHILSLQKELQLTWDTSRDAVLLEALDMERKQHRTQKMHQEFGSPETQVTAATASTEAHTLDGGGVSSTPGRGIGYFTTTPDESSPSNRFGSFAVVMQEESPSSSLGLSFCEEGQTPQQLQFPTKPPTSGSEQQDVSASSDADETENAEPVVNLSEAKPEANQEVVPSSPFTAASSTSSPLHVDRYQDQPLSPSEGASSKQAARITREAIWRPRQTLPSSAELSANTNSTDADIVESDQEAMHERVHYLSNRNRKLLYVVLRLVQVLKSKNSKEIETTPSEKEAHREVMEIVQNLLQEAKGQEGKGYSESELPEQNAEITSRSIDLVRGPQKDSEVKTSRNVMALLSTNKVNREADSLASLSAKEQTSQVPSRCLLNPEEAGKKCQLEISRDQDLVEECNGEMGVPQSGEEMFQRQAPVSTVNMLEAHSDGETSPQAEVQTKFRSFLPIFNRRQDKNVTVQPSQSIPVTDEDETNSLKKKLENALRKMRQLEEQSRQAEKEREYSATTISSQIRTLEQKKKQMDALQKEVFELKDQKASLENAREILQSQACAQEERLANVGTMLEETVLRAALLDIALSAHSKELEESLSRHESELESASDLFDALDKQISELKDQNAALEEEKVRLSEDRDSLIRHVPEKEEAIARAALLATELASVKAAIDKRSKELEESLSKNQADLESAREREEVLEKVVVELKDNKASLDEEKVILCAERDSLRSQVAEKVESVVNASNRLDESVAHTALLDTELASLKEAFDKQSKELEESLSRHHSEMEDQERIAALDKLVSELKDENAALEDERCSLQGQVGEKQEIVAHAALLDTELASVKEASEKRAKELEESLSMYQAGLQTARELIDVMDNAIAELKDEKASLEEEKTRWCEERDSMQSLAAEKEERSADADRKLEETLVRTAMLGTELATVKESSEKCSKELEESLSRHQSDLESARQRIGALDKQVLELKDQNAAFGEEKIRLSEERDSLNSQVQEKEDSNARAALLATELVSVKEASEKRSKELDESLSTNHALAKAVVDLKDERTRMCEERDALHIQQGIVIDGETVSRAALFDTELASVKDMSDKRSRRELKESLSTHQSDLEEAREHVDALKKVVQELKDIVRSYVM
jgi:hypothetical protein